MFSLIFKVLLSLSTPAMASTPDNKSTRPVSAPVMSPLSPREATPSPLLPTLPRSDHHDSSTPKDHRSADRKAEGKAQSQPAEYTKSHSPRPESTPEIKVVDTVLYISTFVLGSIKRSLIIELNWRGCRAPTIRGQGRGHRKEIFNGVTEFVRP